VPLRHGADRRHVGGLAEEMHRHEEPDGARAGEHGFVGDGPGQAGFEKEGKDVLSYGLFRAPHPPWRLAEHLKMLVHGAVDLFGRRQGLPTAVSGAQNYFLWGPGERSGSVMIAVSFPEEVLRPWFGRVELAGEVRCQYCMPDRQLQRIYVCRDPVRPLADFWPLTKCWTCDRPPFATAPGR
jgi:hypothetical protein